MIGRGNQPTFAILAGGQSSRMGQDKAFLHLHGKPIISLVLERGLQITDTIFVITNQPEAYQFLKVPLFPDRKRAIGPLAGLHTALWNAKSKYLILVGCDMPFISPPLLAYQLDLLDQCGLDAAVPRHGDVLEPLHGVYRRDACLHVVETALAEGERSLVRWHNRICVREVGESEIRAFDPGLLCFTNLNTPEEYQDCIRNCSI